MSLYLTDDMVQQAEIALPSNFYSGTQGARGGLEWAHDGSRVFVCGWDDNYDGLIVWYDCTDAFDLSTASSSPDGSWTPSLGRCHDLKFNSDGTKMYVREYTPDDLVVQYNLNTAYEPNNNNVGNFYISGNPTRKGFDISGDGKYLYISNGGRYQQREMSTPWEIDTVGSEIKSFTPANIDSPENISFIPDGTRVYYTDKSNNHYGMADLSTPWELDSATHKWTDTYSRGDVSDVKWDDDGDRLYMTTSDGSQLYVEEFDIPTNNLLVQLGNVDLSDQSDVELTVYEDINGNGDGVQTDPDGRPYNRKDTVSLSDSVTSYPVGEFNADIGDEYWIDIQFNGSIEAESYVRQPIEVTGFTYEETDGDIDLQTIHYQPLNISGGGDSNVSVSTDPASIDFESVDIDYVNTPVEAQAGILDYEFSLFPISGSGTGETSSTVDPAPIRFEIEDGFRTLDYDGVIALHYKTGDTDVIFETFDPSVETSGEIEASPEPAEIDFALTGDSGNSMEAVISGVGVWAEKDDVDFQVFGPSIELSGEAKLKADPAEIDFFILPIPTELDMEAPEDGTSIEFKPIGGYNSKDGSSGGSFGPTYGAGPLQLNVYFETHDPEAVGQGEVEAVAETAEFEIQPNSGKGGALTPKFTGEITPTPDPVEFEISTVDADVYGQGETISDIPLHTFAYEPINTVPFQGSGDFVRPRALEFHLNTTPSDPTGEGETTANAGEPIEYELFPVGARPLWGSGEFAQPDPLEFNITAVETDSLGEGGHEAEAKKYKYEIKPVNPLSLLDPGDFVTTGSMAFRLNAIDPLAGTTDPEPTPLSVEYDFQPHDVKPMGPGEYARPVMEDIEFEALDPYAIKPDAHDLDGAKIEFEALDLHSGPYAQEIEFKLLEPSIEITGEVESSAKKVDFTLSPDEPPIEVSEVVLDMPYVVFDFVGGDEQTVSYSFEPPGPGQAGIQLYTNKTHDNEIVDPVSDIGPGGGRDGDPLFVNTQFDGNNGDVKFTRIYLKNNSPRLNYSNVHLSSDDDRPGNEHSLNIQDSFTAQRGDGTKITIPPSMVGQARIQFYYEPNQDSIPLDPEAYSPAIDVGEVGPRGSTRDHVEIYMMMVVDPGTDDGVINEFHPQIDAQEHIPVR